MEARTGWQEANRRAIRAYVETSPNGAILCQLYQYGGIEADPASIAAGIVFAESTLGTNLVSTDRMGHNIGWWQNQIWVVIAREEDAVHGPVDSTAIAERLINERSYDNYHGTLTLIEMTRHHLNMGRRGERLLRASIRSFNAGHRRHKYMSRAATIYRDRVLAFAAHE